MIDTRWKQLADILVDYSVEVKRGDRVLITMMEVDTFPLARAVYQAAVRAGGLPFVEFQSAYLERDLMKTGSKEQVDWICEMQTLRHGMGRHVHRPAWRPQSQRICGRGRHDDHRPQESHGPYLGLAQ